MEEDINVSIEDIEVLSVEEGTTVDLEDIDSKEKIRQQNEVVRQSNETARESYINTFKTQVEQGVYKGDKGDKGDTGEKGDKGDKGETGEQGIQGIQGERGLQGIQGEQGIQGIQGEPGQDGEDGQDGQDGFSPTVSVNKVNKTTTIVITDKNGEHTATIQDGQDGSGAGDMLKSVYDKNDTGIVDNAQKVNNHTVDKDVPNNAVFTDKNATWGNITGTLSNQSDLDTALSGKQAKIDSSNKLNADLIDDSTSSNKFVSASDKNTWNAKSDFSGSYNDLSNKPSIPSKTSDLTNDSDFISKSNTSGLIKNDGTIDSTNYSTFSGSYNDLSNKPTIPDELADLSDDSTHRLVTDSEKTTWNNKSDFSGDYDDLTNKPTIPTATSDLTNDSNFTTLSSVHSDLVDYVGSLSNLNFNADDIVDALNILDDYINNKILTILGLDTDNWSSSNTYAKGDTCCYDNKIYMNLTGTNTSTNPASDTTNWEHEPIITF